MPSTIGKAPSSARSQPPMVTPGGRLHHCSSDFQESHLHIRGSRQILQVVPPAARTSFLNRGPQFISRVWKAFFTCLGVAVNLSSGYHPQTNGQMERKIQEISRYLRTFCHGHQDSWSQYLGWAEYAQNSLRQPSTGLTPFQCVLGYQPPLFPWSGEPSDVQEVDHWFRKGERVWDSMHHQLQCALRRRRWTAVRRTCLSTGAEEPGDEAAEPPLPLLLDDGTAYGVKEILDSRRRGGQLEYLVEWEGYGLEECSWVPRDDILDPNLLETFHAAHPNRSAPRGRGRPWLEQHNPILSWRTGEVLKWGDTCFPGCFPELPVQQSPIPTPLHVQATSIESPFVNRPLEIPTCYAPFSDVFCPKRASKLPPHRPWDCAIDLLPGEPVPRGRIYPLSIPEETVMEEYIKEALAQGYIRPSTSRAASSFFFMAKKDGGLRPCIDYRALNRITLKFRYPLPLVPAALEHLRGATIFTKLDLLSAYNLIRIREGDEWKTAFITPTGHYEYLVMLYGHTNAPSVFQDFIHKVLREFLHRTPEELFLKAEKCSFHQPSVQFLGYKIDSSGIQMDEGNITAIRNWLAPTTVKELQRFLGFANFYRWFIQNYSSIANPLTSLLWNKPKSLAWSPAAEEAFNTLKKAFTTAPLLIHPDPDKPFIMEVDASMTGVGAVLSQQQGNPSCLHPCVFFSRKLNPTESNYDIGNRELLAVKVALEEWRHWLEGAKHPFLVLTDHKNLEYLRAAKRLNPRQARWALFFIWFDFTLSYRPGSKNTKADALSRMFAPEENPETPEPILPERIIVSPIAWSEETLPPANAPLGYPPGLQYITRARCTSLIHTSLGTGHPGINETFSLLKDRFWWPNMAADIRRYMQGCEECAMSKDPRHLPSGKLLPLPVPSRPWSHLGVDFITDLPTSRSHTCIFVIVDRFSKSCRLLPLKGPPTALEVAELMFNHVFRYFGIPEDIVSDRGPQFISRVWRAFFTCLGVAVNLSSGYHPQTNGQTERKIQEISCYLRTICHSHQDSWSQYLGWAEYAQNSLRQPSTGLTPFQCVLGYQPPLFPWSGEPPCHIITISVFPPHVSVDKAKLLRPAVSGWIVTDPTRSFRET
ncbi:hypothetical protein QTP70_034526 [Hemibagrus guttatus]|uniref:Gypsy retrotransposon integrase-like protein 1 n=1 Tax=Hemibagrus guttatus TaxID=175788 RepID=A0AAE0R302_9TELE|nr:hypothetical protein QTP70_034526 [Hemibagrus guttatus]